MTTTDNKGPERVKPNNMMRLKYWFLAHVYENNGYLLGLIKFYRISGVCRAEMVYRHDDYDSNFMCPICKQNTYNWKWLPYKPKAKAKFHPRIGSIIKC